VAGELDAVVVGGGDGSIRTVASVLAGSDVPLGIIPLGTLNHFARDLRIPVFADRAVAVIASGEQRYVDVGEINGKIFINNSSIGIYPYLVLERERRRRRKRLSKWSAIVLALPRAIRHLPLFQLRVRIQGFVETCRSPCVLIGNNEYRLTVPAFGRRDRLDRGELCLYVAKAQIPLLLFWLACRCILGLLDQQRDLASSRAIPRISARIGDAYSLRLMVRLKPYRRLCITGPGQGPCAYSLRLRRTHDGQETCRSADRTAEAGLSWYRRQVGRLRHRLKTWCRVDGQTSYQKSWPV